METAADGGGRVKWKPQKLTMEEYLFFVDNNKLVDLTVDQLNQIIDIHGFKKMHKTPKRILNEAVSTMELMKPSRSTLQDDGVSSCAMMSLDDVTKDLNDLSWQECCVTSLQMINSVDVQPHHHLNAVTNSNAPSASGSKAKPKRQRNRLRKLMINNVNSNDNSASAGGGSGADCGDVASHGLGSRGSQSASCSSVICGGGGGRAMKLVPKRKRSARDGGGGGGGSALV